MADDDDDQSNAGGLRRMRSLPKRKKTINPFPPLFHDTSRTDVITTSTQKLMNTFSWSSSLAPKSYYPVFNNLQDSVFNKEIDTFQVEPSDLERRINDLSFSDSRDELAEGETDYADHLQQPGNNKKRKVPVTAHSRPDAEKPGSPGEEEDFSDRLFLPDRRDMGYENMSPGSPIPLASRSGRISRATHAALQLKELLKSRKHQLANVLGSLSGGDTFALDQALSSNYYTFSKISQDQSGGAADQPPIRLSRRPIRRWVREARAIPDIDRDSSIRFPERPFTFKCISATSERVRATSDEVAGLQARFEAELSRQAAKAAEAARQAALAVTQMQKNQGGGRNRQRSRTSAQVAADGDESPTSSDRVLGTKSKSKKKKRSALANASNPHHLRNYVPSRLPHSGLAHSALGAFSQNTLSPLPLQFLSAELPPRRKKSDPPVHSLVSLTNPEEEWLCAFCEYNLFYGDEHSYRRAIRQRKKILRRRRRAMERAAAAAAGRKKAVTSPDVNESVDDEMADTYALDATVSDTQRAPKQMKMKEEQDRDRDKGRDRRI